MLPRFKIGICHCSECNGRETEGRKIGKVFSCIGSYRKEKAKQYEANARQKSKVRLLGKKQVSNGNYFEAERQALVNDLDAVTSKLVRYMAANSHQMIMCYTCDKPLTIALAQCMHFIPRAVMGLRWDYRRNLRAGCKKCNQLENGNLEEYEKRLNEEQDGLPEQLKQEAREVVNISREELKQMLIDYRNKLRILENKFIT